MILRSNLWVTARDITAGAGATTTAGDIAMAGGITTVGDIAMVGAVPIPTAGMAIPVGGASYRNGTCVAEAAVRREPRSGRASAPALDRKQRREQTGTLIAFWPGAGKARNHSTRDRRLSPMRVSALKAPGCYG